MFPQTVKELFQSEFDPIYLEDKIAYAEQISYCILKKIENQTTHKLKLICSKQKCLFNIKLELSPIENKYYLRDLHAEHNHSISKDKFEEKMLTSRLLKFADFIYKTYFLSESEFCSKPKLILKDLKAKHNLDVLAGNYTAAQKQKLKKKFDNIVQQLRLKKNRALEIAGVDGVANSATAILPQFTSRACDNDLSSSVHLQSIPMQYVKKTSSNSCYPSIRDQANSLSTAINSIGDSTNKSINNRITSSSGSNFDFQNQETIHQQSIFSPSQNNSSAPQIFSQNGNLQLNMMNNVPTLINPHFQLSLLQQQQLLQHQAQQQQLQQQALMKKITPQVISEDSFSGSFCKVEDFGEAQSAASGTNLDSSLPRKMLKVQNSLIPMIQNQINIIPIQQLQQSHFNNNINTSGIPSQMVGLPSNYDFNVFQSANMISQQSQPNTTEQQMMMKLHENQIQQEQMKQEELKLKNLINQQRRIQQQQQQFQQQTINPISSLMFSSNLPLVNQQSHLQNPQQLMNLQLLLQNQQAQRSDLAAAHPLRTLQLPFYSSTGMIPTSSA